MGNYSDCSNFICVADSFIRSRVKNYFAYENSVVRHQNISRLQKKNHLIVDISILISSYASSIGCFWMSAVSSFLSWNLHSCVVILLRNKMESFLNVTSTRISNDDLG
jgi:hypothetical protein